MPRVPSRQVSRSALPGVRVSPQAPAGAFGVADQGPDISGVTRLVAGIVQEERAKADQIAFMEADSQLAALETDLLHNPQTGVMNRRGKDSFGAPEEVDEAWQKRTGEIEKGLKTDAQRLAFRRSAEQRGAMVGRAVQQHLSGEMRAYDSETTKTFIDTEHSAALANFQDPERVTLAITRQRAALADHAKRNGKSPEWTAQAQTEAASRTHSGVISRFIALGQDQAASRYYAEHKAEITGEHQEAVDRALEQASTLGEAQRRADAIIKQKGITRTDAFEQARAIEAPQIRKATEQQLDTEFSRRERAEGEAHDDVLNRATAYADRGEEIPASLRALLKPGELRSLNSLRRSVVRGDFIETDQSTYYALQRMAVDPKTRSEFAQLNLNTYRDRLSNSDFQEMGRLQMNVIKKGGEAVRGILTDRNIVDQTIGVLFPNAGQSTNEGRKQQSEMAVFRREIDEDIRAEKRRTGKDELAPEVVQKITDAAVLRRTFQSSDDTTRMPTEQIPKEERDAIVRLLRNNGLTVRTDKIERMFAASLMGNRALFDRIAREP